MTKVLFCIVSYVIGLLIGVVIYRNGFMNNGLFYILIAVAIAFIIWGRANEKKLIAYENKIITAVIGKSKKNKQKRLSK